MSRVLAAALVLLFAACDEPAQKPQTAKEPTATAVRAAMAEMFAYSEKVLASLPEAEREALKREADQLAERFRTRIPDLDALERIARDCEKSSQAFARVAPQVMFLKKKSGASD